MIKIMADSLRQYIKGFKNNFTPCLVRVTCSDNTFSVAAGKPGISIDLANSFFAKGWRTVYSYPNCKLNNSFNIFA